MRFLAQSALAAFLLTSAANAAPLPQAAAFDPSTSAQVGSASPVSPLRTRHKDASGAPIYTNRLVLARSPYLRQHAHNPVNWQKWGEDAFAEARSRGVPIFLSIGYATCHWCHVMEDESFDDISVAAALNANFVPIKVDRETLPDIDAQYMLATQILTGRGGWPNNLFLTPDGQPFVAMGYAPRNIFQESVLGLADDWRHPEGRKSMIDQAASVSEFVKLISGARQTVADVDESVMSRAVESLLADYDDFQGGFGKGPKFPSETNLRFLLDRYERTGESPALDAALVSLHAMAAGGIDDHVGGGFHRYAVDANWRTPHFEKMLYTQALLSRNYLQAYRLTNDPVLARAVRRTLDYVLRDMISPEGAFYAAQDADSAPFPGGENEEGAYYTWTHDQVAAAVGGDAPYILSALGLDQPATVPSGSVTHYDPQALPDFTRLDPILERMRRARSNRPAPLTDTKIIAGWNGLMIRALVDGSETLGDPRYLAAAERAAGFIVSRMISPTAELARAWEGAAIEAGSLRDYAWLGLAHVALFDATNNPAHLATAQRLAEAIKSRFSDGADKPLRLAQRSGPLGPAYDVIEGATPTGNAAAIELFAMLAQRGTDDGFIVDSQIFADSLIAALSGSIAEAPGANISTLTAIAVHQSGETGATRRLGGGVATATASLSGDKLTVDIDFMQGWHANANRPLDPDLIPTELSGDGLHSVTYPTPKTVTLGFQSAPLVVLDDEAQISATLSPDAQSADLTIQICSDDRCLPPEQHTFRLPQN